MKRLSILFLLFISLTSVFCQEEIGTDPVYYTYSDYLLAPPGQMDIGLYGFINPAVLGYVNKFDALITLSGPNPEFVPVEQWGFFMALPGIGFGTFKIKQPDETWLMKSRISTGYGTQTISMGFGYEWTKEDGETEDHDNLLTYGILTRPFPHLSFGISGNVNLSFNEYEVALELGVRPFGNNILTLYSDYALVTPTEWSDIFDGELSVGATARLPFLEGIYISGCFFPRSYNFSAGIKVSAGYLATMYQAHFNDSSEFTHYTCSVRAGSSEANPFDAISKGSSYLILNLYGYLDYQGHILFSKRNTLLEVVGTIQAAKTDPAINGIIVDTSGFYADREKIWEIWEALKDFKSSGKKVIVYLESANIDLYLLASVADKIVCDPLGIISLGGYIMGMPFYKGLLEKAGVGFEELRLFKYKSAYEQFSGDVMSESNREQLKEYIDDLYEYTKKAICDSRGISEKDYEKLLNEISLFTADEALSHKLVDTLGRFEKTKEEADGIEGKKMKFIYPDSLPERNRPYSNDWGSKKKIAVIYAIGICDMEIGIAARKLVSDIDKACNDPYIKAVVLRVDSPGGSALAGDIVADAVKRCRKEKPVIISQGFVAASGGYWLSMYGDVIVAAPQTLTGSIGVAGGWFYDNGLKEKLGITTDFVKKGEYADLGFGISIPYIYMGLPDRNLNQGERELMEKFMYATYKDFIKKVAEGRQKSEPEIEEVARGRIWSGIKAKEKGLVDEIGGLARAIEIAKEKAGIPSGEKVIIAEFPEFDLSSLYGPFLSSIGLSTKYRDPYTIPYSIFDLLKFRINHNGKPLPIIDVYTTDLLAPYFAVQESIHNMDQ